MGHPIPIRFKEAAVEARLRQAAGRRALSSLAEELIDEGLRMRRHALIVFRAGPTGRRAALAGGPDVWEVVVGTVGDDVPVEERRARVAEVLGLRPAAVDAALGYYAEFTDEIDELIAANEAAADEAELRWQRANDRLAR